MPAAGRGDVGEDLAAAAGHEPGEVLGLGADLGCGDGGMFMVVLSGTIMSIAGGAGEVEVEGQHPAGARGGVVDGNGARLARRVGGQGPGMPGGESAAAVPRDPDMQGPGQPGRDRLPRRPRAGRGFGGVREPVAARKYCFRVVRRVADRQC